jgi:hypothetical protein
LPQIADALGVGVLWLAFGNPADSNADDGAGGGFIRDKEDRLFAWAIHRVAKMLVEENLDGDLAYLEACTWKIMGTAPILTDEAEAKNFILGTIALEQAVL